MEALQDDDGFFELGDEVRGDEKVWSALEDYAKKNAMAFPTAAN